MPSARFPDSRSSLSRRTTSAACPASRQDAGPVLPRRTGARPCRIWRNTRCTSPQALRRWRTCASRYSSVPSAYTPPPLSKLVAGPGYSPGTTPPAISHRISSPSGRLSSSCKALNTPPHRSYTLRYLKNTTVFYQNKFNKNLKSLKAQHGVQIISDPDCRKPPGLFSATPKVHGGEGRMWGNTLPPS